MPQHRPRVRLEPSPSPRRKPHTRRPGGGRRGRAVRFAETGRRRWRGLLQDWRGLGMATVLRRSPAASTHRCSTTALSLPQEAPAGNPGTPGPKTTPPPMPVDGGQFPGSNPPRMAPGTGCQPESPCVRRGLFGRVAPVNRHAKLENPNHRNRDSGFPGATRLTVCVAVNALSPRSTLSRLAAALARSAAISARHPWIARAERRSVASAPLLRSPPVETQKHGGRHPIECRPGWVFYRRRIVATATRPDRGSMHPDHSRLRTSGRHQRATSGREADASRTG